MAKLASPFTRIAGSRALSHIAVLWGILSWVLMALLIAAVAKASATLPVLTASVLIAWAVLGIVVAAALVLPSSRDGVLK